MEHIIGHTHITSYLTQAYAQGKLHHAYLFVGPHSVGKRAVAEALAAQIFDIQVSELMRQPDYLFVSQIENEKTGALRKDITIAQMRTVRDAMHHKPLVKKHKIVIIDSAERLNTLAANALLKTLEEPAIHAHLFLLTARPQELPSTIRSRCHMIEFSPVDRDVIQSASAQQHITYTDEMLAYAHGLPGRFLQFVSHPETLNEYMFELQRFESLFHVSFHEKMTLIESLFDKSTDHTRQRQKIYDILGIWLEQLSADSPLIDADIPHEAVYEALMRARYQILKNVHPRLILENTLLQFS